MGAVWTEQTKIEKWLDVELAALDALAKYNYIPKRIPPIVRKKASFNLKNIKKIEKAVQHDVIAFLTDLESRVGEAGRYVHFGLTSSDVLDTAMALQIKDASKIIEKGCKQLLASIRKVSRKHRFTLMVGRTHGIHAEPTTFGLKMAVFYDELKRCTARFSQAARDIEFGKISGAVGTFANVDPRVEGAVCRSLGLKPEPASTQIIQRDRHAAYLSAIALLGSSMEKLATEIRNLQRTDILEVQEFFGKQQRGSSAMPHKRNPITCERVAGLARILRGNALAGMENVALWHERDITHSSVERVIFPDSTILLDYMLSLMNNVIPNLLVHKDNMMTNMEKSRGMVFSQRLLLALIKKGISRNDAYKMVQRCAKKVWEESLVLYDVVIDDVELNKKLSKQEIESVFDYKYHTKHVETILKRVGI